MHSYVYSSTIYNSQDMEAAYIYIERETKSNTTQP